LLHAQAAAEVLIEAAAARTDGLVSPPGEPRSISAVLSLLTSFHELYAGRGEVPPLSDPFVRDLFNTYRSYLFPAAFPMSATVHADPRGRLFETVRSHGGTGQSFVSTTVPGATRGDHYHLSKVERFFVVSGEAEIALRRLLHDDVVRFRLSGDRPAFVDMPTMWVHNITNVGDSDLVTMFWADQLLDPEHPDQFPELVELAREAAP
jgi:UDP-2-acetamido-2,6-beta-L-arabino-hexul-4-ose reductase